MDDAYENFKKRKSLKRKREATSNRKARSKIGDRARKQTTKPKNPRTYRQDPDVSSDDSVEHVVPEYLQKRRARFEKRTAVLREAGLKLPPKYDDVDFSDDDRLADLQERPDFPRATPAAENKDKQLPYSLGLIPAPIAQWLRDYQVQGVAFLHKLFVYQSGGILGDDMGTVAVIIWCSSWLMAF